MYAEDVCDDEDGADASCETAALAAEATRLRRARGELRLTRRPVRTLSLFACAATRWCAERGAALLRQPLLRRVLLPLLLVLLFVSRVVVASAPTRAFAMLDRDKDGVVHADDLRAYMTARLRSDDGDSSRTTHDNDNKTAAAKAALLSLSALRFPANATVTLTRAQFVRWWRDVGGGGGGGAAAVRDAVFAHGAWREVEYVVADALFWLLLGVLSSAGLGSGLHSGVLFLFPHIYRVCAAFERCGSGSFYTYPRNPLYGPRLRTFVCLAPSSTAAAARSSSLPTAGTAAAAPLSWPLLRARLYKVMPACMAWGAGTALGEVPPYALSYAAATAAAATRRARGRDSALHVHVRSDHDAPCAADATTPAATTTPWWRCNVVQRMTTWMLHMVERHGFWAVLLLSAWPNMAFDLCGMACGRFRMPLVTFLTATLLGKAVVKVNLQALFFVALFSGDNVERLVRRVAVACTLPRARVDAAVAALARARASVAARARNNGGGGVDGGTMTAAAAVPYAGDVDSGESWLVALLQCVAVAAVVSFAKSLVEAMAAGEQARRDAQTLAQRQQRRRHSCNVTAAATSGRQHTLSLSLFAQISCALHLPHAAAAGDTAATATTRRRACHDSCHRRRRGARSEWVCVVAAASLCVAVAVLCGSVPAVTLAASLLLHSLVCEWLRNNASLGCWPRRALRATLAAAVLYALLACDEATT